MRLLIMGPQGVGKGTQAALLSTHYDIPAISTGDIFRFNIKNKTPLGLEALSYTDKGELVPDELTNSIVKDRLAQDDAANGWILDGYPRNASQVEALDAMLSAEGPYLLDVQIPIDQTVYPMVAPGAPIDDIIGALDVTLGGVRVSEKGFGPKKGGE